MTSAERAELELEEKKMGMATTGSCEKCGAEIDLTGKKKHNCIPKCPICNRRVSEFPGQTCAGLHGRCPMCGDWRSTCKCLKSQVMEQMKKPFEQREEIGLKFDGEKIDWAHLPPAATEELLKVYMMGAKKYGRGNYIKGIDFRRIFNAAQRHLWAWKQGEDIDPESGLSHLAHASWNCLTLLYYMLEYAKYQSFDNRSEIIQPPKATVWPDEKEAKARRTEKKEEQLDKEIDQMFCGHEWEWVRQRSDTIGVHITKRCSRCGVERTDVLAAPDPTVSIPSVWLPTPDGMIVEATVTTSNSGGSGAQSYIFVDGKLKALSPPKFKKGDRVKIRAGAPVGQDFAYRKWSGDNHVVFTVREVMSKQGKDEQRYSLYADGYGAGLTATCPGKYGNGCVYVKESDLIDVSGGE